MRKCPHCKSEKTIKVEVDLLDKTGNKIKVDIIQHEKDCKYK